MYNFFINKFIIVTIIILHSSSFGDPKTTLINFIEARINLDYKTISKLVDPGSDKLRKIKNNIESDDPLFIGVINSMSYRIVDFSINDTNAIGIVEYKINNIDAYLDKLDSTYRDAMKYNLDLEPIPKDYFHYLNQTAMIDTILFIDTIYMRKDGSDWKIY